MAEVFKESGPAMVSNFGPLKTLSISDPMMIKKLGAWGGGAFEGLDTHVFP